MAVLASRAAYAGAITNSPDTAAFIDSSGDELILGGRPLSSWIQAFGLPFHVSYAPDIRANLLAYKDVFERLYPRGEVRYAGKASTHPAVFRLAAEAGVGIDVASPYETRCALEAGVPPEKLDVNGNSKDADLINLAISKNMLIIADSFAELERIAELAKSHEETPRFVLRVTGFPSKIYLWGNALGGFAMGPDGVPTTTWEGELFTAPYAKEAMLEAILSDDVSVDGRTMKATEALAAAGSPALMIEPGRSIVSDSGITLARVAFEKRVAGVHNLISLDLGVVNYCEPIVTLPARHWALATGLKQRDPEPFETFIAGNLCFPPICCHASKSHSRASPCVATCS
jgi:diaminopimelate decarboxylase